MNARSLSVIVALALRVLRDAAFNPTVAMMPVAGYVIVSLFSGSLGDPGRDAWMELVGATLLTHAACAMVGGTMLIYVAAEERERGVFLTLRNAGVTVAQIAAAKLLAAFVASMLVSAALYALAGLPAHAFPAVMLACACMGAVIFPLSLAGAFMSRDQMRSGVWAACVVTVAMASFLGVAKESVHAVVAFFPAGAACEVVRMAFSIQTAVPPVLVIVLQCVWTAAFFALAVFAARRLEGALRAEMMRENP